MGASCVHRHLEAFYAPCAREENHIFHVKSSTSVDIIRGHSTLFPSPSPVTTGGNQAWCTKTDDEPRCVGEVCPWIRLIPQAAVAEPDATAAAASHGLIHPTACP